MIYTYHINRIIYTQLYSNTTHVLVNCFNICNQYFHFHLKTTVSLSHYLILVLLSVLRWEEWCRLKYTTIYKLLKKTNPLSLIIKPFLYQLYFIFINRQRITSSCVNSRPRSTLAIIAQKTHQTAAIFIRGK